MNKKHYSEITEKAFFVILGKEYVEPVEILQSKLADGVEYVIHGVRLFALQNKVSSVTQYYVQDINA